MALLLHERAIKTESQDLVRLTLIENGAAPQLVEALIPQRPLEPGEQYRFHFDMTKCIGCRSCEIACNEQNGNPADIQWRRVGELEGGVYPEVHRTYLSMGCNHCLSADCLRGCPVNAYTKDPLTGIVLHSAEACIGCQYCVWNCPYSVPKFNPERGVVGKCDMCRNRLLDNREPACVSACPENAISIEIVNKEQWRADYAAAEAPGMPPAGQTLSTTRITLPESSTSWLQRVDTGAVPLEHAHPSLVLMTTAMQAAFGTLAVSWATHALDAITLTLVVALTVVALTVSVFHLGRPAYAWRAVKMWRRSWLSREVLCFGLFFGSLCTATACSWLALSLLPMAHVIVAPAVWAAVVFGAAGALASACIYLVKARPAWNMAHTPVDFFLSAGLMGTATAGAMQVPAELLARLVAYAGIDVQPTYVHMNARVALVFAAAWVANQAVKVIRLRASRNFEARASYNLLHSDPLLYLLALACLCALATPVFLREPLTPLAMTAAFAAVLLGRYLFFVSVVPLGMALTFLQRTEIA